MRREQLGAVPDGAPFVPLCRPGTYVPGFLVSPLRGWSNNTFHFLAALGVATQTLKAVPFPILSKLVMNTPG